MEIQRIYYPVLTLGFGRRIGIWTIGCPHGCPGCSNPELWDSQPDKEVTTEKLQSLLSSISEPVDGVTISGGEPFAQPESLANLVSYISAHISSDILVYSGYTKEELHAMGNPIVDRVLANIAALIDGKYMEELNDDRPLMGSSNQRLHVLKEDYRSKYETLLEEDRTVQTVFNGNGMIAIGIPKKHNRKRLGAELRRRGIQI